jgi:hypothetical protein
MIMVGGLEHFGTFGLFVHSGGFPNRSQLTTSSEGCLHESLCGCQALAFKLCGQPARLPVTKQVEEGRQKSFGD